jgi:hypothetical protein
MKALAVLLATSATIAVAAETAQWPPPLPVEARMKELQAVIGGKESTPAQREAARKELSGLLKSPAGRARGATPDEKPARSAIEPLPSLVKPADGAVPVAPPVARLDVVPAPPPKMLVIPGTGSAATPSGRFAIDPRTGAVLHEIPGGYIDPRTGQVTPR